MPARQSLKVTSNVFTFLNTDHTYLNILQIMFTNSGINKVFLLGKIGEEPQLLDVGDQREVLCFPLITNEIIKKNGEDFELTERHNIKVPREVAATSKQQLQQGHLIYLEGKIQTRSFYDEQHIKNYRLEIIASKFQILNTILEMQKV